MIEVNNTTLEGWEALVRAGSGKLVFDQISKIPPRHIPRRYLSQIATLLNRVGGSTHCMRLLHPLVRGENRTVTASDPEVVEYAKALIEIGAAEEGTLLLKQVQGDHSPQLLLTKVFRYFRAWNYADAVPLLEEYLEQIRTPYESLVGKINYSSALINLGQHSRALNLIFEIKKQSLEQNLHLIQGYALEQVGQIFFREKKYDEALPQLHSSLEILKNSNQRALLYPRKWLALISILQFSDTSKLEALISDCREFRDFETLRDLDFWKGQLTQNDKLLNKVHYQTPYPDFCARIDNRSLDSSWSWSDREINLCNLSEAFGTQLPNSSDKTMQLLCFLLTDGYRPLTTGELFSKLYPNEFFDPFTSSDRLYQIVKRLRENLFAFPEVQVLLDRGSYSINIPSSCDFPFQIERQQKSLLNEPTKFFVDRVKRIFGGQAFTAGQLATALQMNHRTLNRWLASEVEAGRLTQFGKAKATRFQVHSIYSAEAA